MVAGIGRSVEEVQGASTLGLVSPEESAEGSSSSVCAGTNLQAKVCARLECPYIRNSSVQLLKNGKATGGLQMIRKKNRWDISRNA